LEGEELAIQSRVDVDRNCLRERGAGHARQPYVSRFGSRREAAPRDLVQETYLRASEARETFRPGASMRAWLARILRNRFIDRFRRVKREAHGPTAPKSRRRSRLCAMNRRGSSGTRSWPGLMSLVRGDIERALQALPEGPPHG